MRLWAWLTSLFRHRPRAVRDPPDAAERFRRDAEAATAARASEAGLTSGSPPSA